MFDTVDKKLVVAICAVAWLVVLAWLVLHRLGGSIPPMPMAGSNAGAISKLHTVREVEDLFSLALYQRIKPAINLQNPFYPNPKQPLPPPALPSATKSVELVYQGYFATSRGEKTAYLQVGDQSMMGTNGAKVLNVYKISDIGVNSLTLHDPSGKPLVLEFRARKIIEVPIP